MSSPARSDVKIMSAMNNDGTRRFIGPNPKISPIRSPSRSLHSPEHAQSSLSPLSFCSAKDAENETIRRLRLECHGLSTALKSLKKHSNEWVLIHSRLEVAEEELEAMLLDRDFFLFEDSKDDDEHDDRSKNYGRSHSDSAIPTPALLSGLDKRSSSFHYDGDGSGLPDHERMISLIPTPPFITTSESQDLELRILHLKSQLDSVQKFSLEYFQIKKDLCELENEGSCSDDKRSNDMKVSQEHINGGDGTIAEKIQNQRDRLRSVPKYSLEWFEIKTKIGELNRKEGSCHDDENRGSQDERKSSNSVSDSEESDGSEEDNFQRLRDRLRSVPKYSREWFRIKKEIFRELHKEGRKSSGSGSDEGGSTVSDLSQHDNLLADFLSDDVRPVSGQKESKDSHLEKKLQRQIKKLDNAPKFSLEYFQIKRDIGGLQKEMERRRARNAKDRLG